MMCGDEGLLLRVDWVRLYMQVTSRRVVRAYADSCVTVLYV